MSFLIWLLGLVMMAAGAAILHKMLKNVTWPYNRFVFENSNENGVIGFTTWEEKVEFDKYRVKKRMLENAYGLPGAFLLCVGFLMFWFKTFNFLFL